MADEIANEDTGYRPTITLTDAQISQSAQSIGSTIDAQQRRMLQPIQPKPMPSAMDRAIAAMPQMTETILPRQEVPSLASLSAERATADNERLMASVGSVADKNPDEQAAAKKLADDFGISTQTALANMKDLRRRALLNDMGQRDLVSTAPKLANMLSDPNFAGVAHDDIDNLSRVERVFGWIGNTWDNWTNSVTAGILQTQQAYYQYDWLASGVGDKIDPYLKNTIDAYGQQIEALHVQPGWQQAAGTIVGQQMETLPRVGEWAATGGLAGGGAGLVGGTAFLPSEIVTVPAGILFGMGVGAKTGFAAETYKQEAAGAYAEMMRLTNGDDRASRYVAMGVGGVNAAIEMALLPVVTSSFKAGARKIVMGEVSKRIAEGLSKASVRKAFGQIGKNLAKEVTGNVAEEVGQELVSIIGEHAAMRLHDPNAIAQMDTAQGRAEIADRLVEIGIQTAMGMAVVGGVGPAFELSTHMREIRRMNREQRALTELIGTAKDSKVRKRSPGTFEAFVAATARDTDASTVYVNAEAMRETLRQEGIIREQLEEVIPGITAQLDATASDPDAKVKIPTEQFASRLVGTKLGDALRQHMTLSENAPSIYQHQQQARANEEMKQRAAQILEDRAEKDESFVTQVRDIEREIEDQLVKTGQYTKDQARTMAALVGANYAVDADELGVSPKELYEQDKYRVSGQQVATEAMPQLAQGPLADNKIMVEVAPDPTNKILSEQWGALDTGQQNRVTQRVIGMLVPRVLNEIKASGQAQMVVGGYQDLTNPSVIVSIDDPSMLVPIAKILGYALDQQGMLAVSATPNAEMSAVGAISISLPDTYGFSEIAELYSRLRNLKDENGNHLVGGHTTADGKMVILNYSGIDTAALAAMIDAHLDGAFPVVGNDVFAAYLEAKDYDYDSPTVQQPIAGRSSSASWIRDIRESTAGDFQRFVNDELYARDRGGSNARPPNRPLEGAPPVAGATGPDLNLVAVAEKYARENNIPFGRQAYYAIAIRSLGKRIAKAYEEMRHAPQDPIVKEAYAELIRQTTAQYQALVDAGYQFYFFDPSNDPYADMPGGFGNPFNAVRDLRQNKRMAVYPTDAGFGSGDTDIDVSNNPLLADTGIMWPTGTPDGPLKPVLANDLFRAVHDAFGHGLEGAGFRADGEENAWQAHVRLFTGLAIGAMTSETRGQNSWLNFGPHGEKNRTAKVETTTFADQKTGLMPSWTWTTGVVPNEDETQFQQLPKQAAFYSAMRREIDLLDVKSMAASGWNQRLKGLVSSGKVKEQEILWSGLQEWLAMQPGKITKEQVQDFLNNNGVRVEVIQRGGTKDDAAMSKTLQDILTIGGTTETKEAWDTITNAGYKPVIIESKLHFEDEYGTYWIRENMPDILGERYGTDSEMTERALMAVDLINDATLQIPALSAFKRSLFGTYTEPGGENYREQLIVAPPESFVTSLEVAEPAAKKIQELQAELDAIIKPFEQEREPVRQRIYRLRDEQKDLNKTASSLTTAVLSNEVVGVEADVVRNKIAEAMERISAIENEIDDARSENNRSYAAQSAATADVEKRLVQAQRDFGNLISVPKYVHPHHFKEENILVHVRMTDRVADNGDSVLRVEEIQSDWGQQKREVGFTPKESVQEIVDLAQDDRNRFYAGKGEMSDEEWSALSARVKEWDEKEAAARKGVPRGPFVHDTDAWTTLALKQTLIEAINGGYDRVVFATGAQNIARYGRLSESQREGLNKYYNDLVPSLANKLLKKLGAERMTVAYDYGEDLGGQWTIVITPELREKVLGEGLPLYQKRKEGFRGTFNPRTLTTTITNTGDESTFFHETGHFFLTLLANRASRTNATPRMIADMQTVLDWFGVKDLATWNAMSLEQQRKYHEQWAYNFEIYLSEGKAPSVAMEGVFAKYAAWLKKVYVSIRDELNAIYKREYGTDLPILTGDVRRVMDRLLATDDQIAHAEAVRNMRPMFLTQEESGMNDAEWAAYQQMAEEARLAAVVDLNTASIKQMQWMSNARLRVLKALQKEHDEKRVEVREEVRAQVRVEPLYRAMHYLRTGKFIDVDGEEREVEGAHRMDVEAIKKMYSLEPEQLRPDISQLTRGKYRMIGTDGVHPDIIADLFGFSSGDQMLRALLAAKPFKEEVDARTDARMLAEFGDMNTPEAQNAAVEKALHNEARSRFVAVELRFLAKATNPVKVMIDAAKSAARQIIGNKVINDLRPSEYANAEARAARDAETSAGAQVDPEAIAKAAYTRAYNEAKRAGAPEELAVSKASEAMRDALARAQDRQNRHSAKYGDRSAAEIAILAKQRQLLNNQLAAEAMEARDEIDSGIKYLRKVLDGKNVQRMGAEAAEQIAKLLHRFDIAKMPASELEKKKALAAYLREMEESGIPVDVSDLVAAEALQKPYQLLTVDEFRDLVDTVKRMEYVGKNATKIRLANEKAEFVEVRNALVDSIVENRRGKQLSPRTATTSAGRRIEAVRAFFAAHLKVAAILRIFDGGKDNGLAWQYFMRTANEAGNKETSMIAEAATKLAEILKPVKALGNMESDRIEFPSIGRAMTRGERFVLALNMGNAGNIQRVLGGENWTMEQIRPVLARLTAAEWRAVQQIWDLFESFKPMVAEKERRLYGKEPTWVEPQPLSIRTADGQDITLAGGYYPIKYDPMASDRVEQEMNAEEAKASMRGAYTAATTRRSYVKSRVREVNNRPILLTMSGVFSGLNEVIHDLAWHEWLISANRMMRDYAFANAVNRAYGPEIKRQIKTWIEAIAAGQRVPESGADRLATFLRRSISASRLGFNAFTAIMQVTGFTNSVTRIGAKWVAIGVQSFAAAPFESARMVREKSTFMRERGRTQFRDLAEIQNMVQDQSRIGRAMQSNVYIFVSKMQAMVDIPTWMGAYEKALHEGMDEDTAIAVADQAVMDSQGSGTIKDLAAVERGSAWSKLFTVFYGFQNALFNSMATSVMTKSRARAAADLAMLVLIPAAMKYYLTQVMKPSRGEEDDDDGLIKFLAKESILTFTGTMIGTREIGDALVGQTQFGYRGPSGVTAIADFYNLSQQAYQGEMDAAFRRATINMAGDLFGVPSAQINRTLDGIESNIDKGTIDVRAPIFGTRR